MLLVVLTRRRKLPSEPTSASSSKSVTSTLRPGTWPSILIRVSGGVLGSGDTWPVSTTYWPDHTSGSSAAHVIVGWEGVGGGAGVGTGGGVGVGRGVRVGVGVAVGIGSGSWARAEAGKSSKRRQRTGKQRTARSTPVRLPGCS